MHAAAIRLLVAALALCALAALAAVAAAQSQREHDGWPEINGALKMNRSDQSRPLTGGHRNDELLGGHGHDTLRGNGGRDVIWGDYKPSGQPESQLDHLDGGAGADFIYASHGRNAIHAGPGDDFVKAHWGRGSIDCGSGRDVLYVSRRAQRGYKIRACERISHKTING